ncbi:hypothetical protein FOZ62_029355 [Perkinsus olseni]|uniref:Uncharacterized protein n=1 Tax=Perkinsus olseni TaxID=32597 RepID=A0A7J6S0Z6_PEROL|nr:hypothetical protein FOZ62_029355 [Perkinsus olseni]
MKGAILGFGRKGELGLGVEDDFKLSGADERQMVSRRETKEAEEVLHHVISHVDDEHKEDVCGKRYNVLYDQMAKSHLNSKDETEAAAGSTSDKNSKSKSSNQNTSRRGLPTHRINTIADKLGDDASDSFDAHVYAPVQDADSKASKKSSRRPTKQQSKPNGKGPSPSAPSTPPANAKVSNNKTTAHLVSNKGSDSYIRVSAANGPDLQLPQSHVLHSSSRQSVQVFIGDHHKSTQAYALDPLDGRPSMREVDWARKVMIMHVGHYSNVVPHLYAAHMSKSGATSSVLEPYALAGSTSGLLRLYEDLYDDVTVYPKDTDIINYGTVSNIDSTLTGTGSDSTGRDLLPPWEAISRKCLGRVTPARRIISIMRPSVA